MVLNQVIFHQSAKLAGGSWRVPASKRPRDDFWEPNVFRSLADVETSRFQDFEMFFEAFETFFMKN